MLLYSIEFSSINECAPAGDEREYSPESQRTSGMLEAQ